MNGCLQCGSPVAKPRNKYCSHSCVGKSKTGPRNWRWKGGPVSRTCEVCSSEFTVPVGSVQNGHGRFCSVPCSDIAKRLPRDGVGTLPQRFWPQVLKTEGCWEWQGQRDANGYGRIHGSDWTTGTRLAHRHAWELVNGGHPCVRGSIPPDIDVCHHCDSPPCVRPDHLFLGTRQDNVNDMVAKGRQPYANLSVCLSGRHPRSGVGRCQECRRETARMFARRKRVSGATAVRENNPNTKIERDSRGWNAHLTTRLVIEIRRRFAAGETMQELASAYAISERSMHDVVAMRTWKHVDEELAAQWPG